MTNRLTKNWTPTTKEAFGATGHKGRVGELFVLQELRAAGYQTRDLESDYKAQCKGIDLEYWDNTNKIWISVDVKNNLNEYGVFYVYSDWIVKSESNYTIHVNTETKWCAKYLTKDMQKYWNTNYKLHRFRIYKNERRYGNANEYMIFNSSNTPEFVQRFRHDKGIIL